MSNSAALAWPSPICWDGELNSHQAFYGLRVGPGAASLPAYRIGGAGAAPSS
jgi:hypothetical protein